MEKERFLQRSSKIQAVASLNISHGTWFIISHPSLKEQDKRAYEQGAIDKTPISFELGAFGVYFYAVSILSALRAGEFSGFWRVC